MPNVRHVGVAAAAVLVGILITGCGADEQGERPGGAPTSSTSTSPVATPDVEVANVRTTPVDGATGVLPSTPVTVETHGGTLTAVTVETADGDKVSGSIEGRDTWTSVELLRPDATYTVTTLVSGDSGRPATHTSTFSTLTPDVTATYGIVYSHQTVGVGMPVSIQFDSPVTSPEFRAEVERHVSVTTSPAQEGAWGWLDNRQLMWRPTSYWEPGTTVTIEADLTGVQTGPVKWVANDASGVYRVGASMVSTVDMDEHVMHVRRNGELVRTIPVSTGKPGPETETRSGTKVIIRKEGEVTMDSATVGIPKGDPDYYKIETKWNLRVTWTGEYLHSAPWSVDAQGSVNVSHGCTNMAPKDAKWMFKHSRVGDVVVFTGSDRVFKPTEGIGVWQYSFSEWQQQSALH